MNQKRCHVKADVFEIFPEDKRGYEEDKRGKKESKRDSVEQQLTI